MITVNSPEKKRGIFIAIKRSVTFKMHKAVVDPQGRYIIPICDLNNTTYTIINVSSPNTGQAKFLRKVYKKSKSLQRGLVLWCGDFNSPLDPLLDTTACKPTYSCHLQSFLQISGLYDVWKCLNTTDKDFTFLKTLLFSPQHMSFSKIDYLLPDLQLLQRVSQATIHSIIWSDHTPILIVLKEGCST